mgnify:CR=1 FL=1
MTEKTQGHGYFRKKKWAKGLVSGIAVAGIVAFSAGSAFADEAVQPESKNDNNIYATQAGKATGSQSVAIDNGAVTKAAEKAKEAGVNVSETQIVDKNAVQLGCSPFDNKRLGIAPKNIVENLIGISFSDIEGEKNGYIKDKEI